MKVFLAMAAVLAWLFALVLLLFPSKSYAPTGMMLTASADEALPQPTGRRDSARRHQSWLRRDRNPLRPQIRPTRDGLRLQVFYRYCSGGV